MPAQLDSAWLSQVELKPDPNFDWLRPGDWNYELRAHAEADEFVEREDGGMNARLRLSVEVEWSEDEETQVVATREKEDRAAERDPPFELRLEVTGLFSWTAEMRPDANRIARLWLDYNGQYLLWPYLRNYIAVLTGMTNVIPLTIETLRVPDPPDLEAEESSEKKMSNAEPR